MVFANLRTKLSIARKTDKSYLTPNLDLNGPRTIVQYSCLIIVKTSFHKTNLNMVYTRWYSHKIKNISTNQYKIRYAITEKRLVPNHAACGSCYVVSKSNFLFKNNVTKFSCVHFEYITTGTFRHCVMDAILYSWKDYTHEYQNTDIGLHANDVPIYPMADPTPLIRSELYKRRESRSKTVNHDIAKMWVPFCHSVDTAHWRLSPNILGTPRVNMIYNNTLNS